MDTTETPAAETPASFDTLGLKDTTARAVKDAGYTVPTEIQAKAIPLILQRNDVIGIARTGTGKTAGFTLPMIDILAGGFAKARMPRALVLAPTRELAAQVTDSFDKYGKHTRLSRALIVGGVAATDQVGALQRGVDVLIATPGRLLDLFERGNILLHDIKMLVIDEADRMLDMGFIPDIERIMKLLPPSRQTLLFSATMADEIAKLARNFMKSPLTISAAPPASPAETVDQHLVTLGSHRAKSATLKRLLREQNVTNAFIFCNRKTEVSALARALAHDGFSAAPLHGDMPQAKRTEALLAFRDGTTAILVCSDVAARGLDISGVSHVFNYDIPFHAEDYVHRIGRTGRAGKRGVAFSLATTGDDDKSVAAIQKLMGRDIPKFDMPPHHASASAACTEEETAEKSPKKPAKAKSAEKPPHKTKPAAAPASKAPRVDKPADDDDGAGFGDHLPAFMRIGR